MSPDAIRLDFRKEPKGGGFAAPDTRGLTARRLTLLIHGYNVDRKGAQDAYQRFQDTQRALGSLKTGSTVFKIPFVEVFWPGDADWGIASFLVYPSAVPKARQAAVLLANVLRTAATVMGNLEVDIVAHSLGARVMAELLQNLEANPGRVSVRRVAVMAAAVPLFKLRPGNRGQLRSGLLTMLGPTRAGKMISLYSPFDDVLSFAFPAGQALAEGDEGGPAVVALGHSEWTGSGVPPSPGFRQHHISKAKHGDYWGHEAKNPGLGQRRAAERIAQFFQEGEVATPREIEKRETFARSSGAARETEPARSLAARKV